MANGNKSGDRVLQKVHTSTLAEAFQVIRILMRKRFAFKEEGKFEIKHSEDGRLITITGPLELGKEKEKYSIFIVRDNIDG